jgi:transposase InsO family protein
VTRAAYYKSIACELSPTAVKQKKIVTEIKRIHALPRLDDYGSPRMVGELSKAGLASSVNTVAKLMRGAGIRARTKPKFRIATTDSKHESPIAPNRLDQLFIALKPNLIWLTDFTYIHTNEGFTYLCTVQDLFSRKIIGWATSRSIDTQLALAAFNQAFTFRCPEPGVVLHSDRGSQFASLEYRNRLITCNCLQSMSRKGNCYDNAPMESFFKSYKSEEVTRQMYQSHEHATRGAVDYIDRFYNQIRTHSALGYLSPNQFEAKWRSAPDRMLA